MLHFLLSAVGRRSAQRGDWYELLDRASGVLYYESEASGFTQWEPPEEFQDDGGFGGVVWTSMCSWVLLTAHVRNHLCCVVCSCVCFFLVFARF